MIRYLASVIVLVSVINLSSSACEARQRSHHHARHHHRHHHIERKPDVNRCISPSVRDPGNIKFGPVNTAKDWAEAKEEVPYTGLNWVNTIEENRMSFTELVHIKQEPARVIQKQETLPRSAYVPALVFVLFSLMAVTTITKPSKSKSI